MKPTPAEAEEVRVQMQLRLPLSLRRKILAKAVEDGTSTNQTLIDLLTKAVET